MQNKTLEEIRTTLHRLLSALPAVKSRYGAEEVRKHLQLIAYYQKQYDRLVQQNQSVPGSA